MSRTSFSPALLERELAGLVPNWPRCRLLVAVSGGADSVALLAAVAELRGRPRHDGLAVRALHVDHGIHAKSRSWASATRRFALGLGIECGVRRARLLVRAGDSLEAEARRARYELFAAALRPGEILVSGHHEDDQAETLLLQLLRGAGVAGLAAMPRSIPFAAGLLVRPLLGVSRTALRAWAHGRHLEWVEDESNADERFDRNFLRAVVLPAVALRWPRNGQVIARAAAHLAEARTLLAELADVDLQGVQEGATLDIGRLHALSPARQRNVVRRWLERSGLPPLDRKRLERILGEVCRARDDALPKVTWAGAEVRRWRRRLYAMRPLPPSPAPLLWRPAVHPELVLPAGLGRLRIVSDPCGPLVGRLPRVLKVSFRAGGERLRTEAGGPNRRLKELLRAADVLPWMRGRIPLIHGKGMLLAVGNLWWNAEACSTVRPERRVRAPRVHIGGARIDWCDAPPVRS